MQDISDRKDIEKLIRNFYDKVVKDDVIGPHFAHVNWEKHLPVMFNFWETVLFFTGNYNGNPMASHKTLHARMPLEPQHFTRWKKLFIETVHENFSGEKADLAINRAESISYLMEQKITEKK